MEDTQPQPAPAPKQLEPTFEQRMELAKTRHEISHFKGVSPDDPMNKMYAFCENIVGASYLPEACRNSVQNLFFLVNVGQDLGLKWTHSLRSMFLTPAGKVGMQGDIMLALLFSNKFKVKILKSTRESAEYHIQRPGGPDEFGWSCEVTYDQAKELGWPYTKSGEIKPPWKDPANMLRWRSLAFTARVVAADLLGGVYLPEEVESFDMEPDASGAFRMSGKEKAEVEADKAAELDPKLAVTVKPKKTTRAAEPASTATVEVKADLSPTEARNEAFIQRAEAKKTEPNGEPANEHGVTDDDLPALNDSTPAADTAMAERETAAKAEAALKLKVRDRVAGLAKNLAADGKPGTASDIGKFVAGYYHDIPGLKSSQLVNSALDQLAKALSEAYDTVTANLAGDPTELGKKIRSIVDEIATTGQLVKEEPASAPVSADDIPGFQWGPETVALARDIISKRKMTEKVFVANLSAFGFKEMPESEARIGLLLYWFAGDSLLTIKRGMAKVPPVLPSGIVELMLKLKWLTETPTRQSNPEVVIKAIMNAMTELS